MSEDLWRLPATELQRRYPRGTLSPVEALASCLARMEEVNPALNAVIARRDGSARCRSAGVRASATRKAGRCRRSTAFR